MESEEELQKIAKIKSSEINRALGIFILVFGLVIIVATFFTITDIGKITNLVAGIILTLIGGGMVIKAKQTIKKIKLG